jgi:hypothetical protein
MNKMSETGDEGISLTTLRHIMVYGFAAIQTLFNLYRMYHFYFGEGRVRRKMRRRKAERKRIRDEKKRIMRQSVIFSLLK